MNCSKANISGNNIHDNERGLYIGNKSHTFLTGNTLLAQNIKDCTFEEIYAEPDCFPVSFQYNQVIDEDNYITNYPLVRYLNNSVNTIYLNVQNNCWGDNFSADSDLISSNAVFYYEPKWCPGNPGPLEPPIDMFKSAIIQYDSENYFNAKSIFKNIVNYYPESIEAESSLKELFSIEQYAENDYYALQQYYRTNDSIIAHSTLSRIGDYFANRCNERLENWVDEISWFENKIANPESESDSIFAILDLASVYMMMEYSPTKSAYIGSMPQLKPKSLKAFLPHRDTLIAMLPITKQSSVLLKKLDSLKEGELLQNVPNPFTNETEIWFKLAKECQVSILISDCMNKEVQKVNLGNLDYGNHSTIINLNDMSSGLYFYSLYIDDVRTDVKKMLKK